jgi:hypothetical protein
VSALPAPGAMPTANSPPAVLNEDLMEKVDTVVAAYADLASGSDGRVSTQLAQSHKPKRHCLRFVFHDKVVSFGVAADLSFGDVARTLRDLVPRHYGEPVSIDCIQTN